MSTAACVFLDVLFGDPPKGVTIFDDVDFFNQDRIPRIAPRVIACRPRTDYRCESDRASNDDFLANHATASFFALRSPVYSGRSRIY